MLQKRTKQDTKYLLLFFCLIFVVIATCCTFSFVAYADTEIATSVFISNYEDLDILILLAFELYNEDTAEMFYTADTFNYDGSLPDGFYYIDYLDIGNCSGEVTLFVYANTYNVDMLPDTIHFSYCYDLDFTIIYGNSFEIEDSDLVLVDYPHTISVNESDVTFSYCVHSAVLSTEEPPPPVESPIIDNNEYSSDEYTFFDLLFTYFTVYNKYSIVDIACLVYIINQLLKLYNLYYRRFTNVRDI